MKNDEAARRVWWFKHIHQSLGELGVSKENQYLLTIKYSPLLKFLYLCGCSPTEAVDDLVATQRSLAISNLGN